MINFPSEITIFFNPCCLFLKSETIDKAISYFINNNLDSLCASRVAQTLCFMNNNPINFSFNVGQPRTQDLDPIHCQTCAFFFFLFGRLKPLKMHTRKIPQVISVENLVLWSFNTRVY